MRFKHSFVKSTSESRLTGDGDQSAVADADDVVPADGLCVFGVGVGHQGADAAPRCQHVSSPYCRRHKHRDSRLREGRTELPVHVNGLL